LDKWKGDHVEFATVRGCGEVGIEFFNIDSDGARVSRDFLRQLVFNIVRRSTAFYDEIQNPGDHIFTYRERQFHSVICPSVSDITRSYVAEHPLSRKPHGEEEFQGRVDYWISYRNYSFLMEVKHAYLAYRRAATPGKKIARRFDLALDQLKSIRKDQCRGLTMNKGLIRLGFETIVFYQGAKNFHDNPVAGVDFRNLFRQLMKNIRPQNRIDMQSLWVLHERLVESWDYGKTSEIYPAVAFIANISEKID
jgi:hypothetical protein